MGSGLRELTKCDGSRRPWPRREHSSAWGLTAAPAAANQVSPSRGCGPARADRPSLTSSQLKALAGAKHLSALRNQHGLITGLVRGPGGAPQAGVCVRASGPLAARRTFTRPDGRFVPAGLPRGAYRVDYRINITLHHG